MADRFAELVATVSADTTRLTAGLAAGQSSLARFGRFATSTTGLVVAAAAAGVPISLKFPAVFEDAMYPNSKK